MPLWSSGIGHRAQDRDLSDEQALERCQQDVRTAITYVLGRIEATGTSPGGETKHRLTMARLRGMPVEMLDRAYNRYRLEHHGINLDDHPNTGPTRPSTRWELLRQATRKWPTSSLKE